MNFRKVTLENNRNCFRKLRENVSLPHTDKLFNPDQCLDSILGNCGNLVVPALYLVIFHSQTH